MINIGICDDEMGIRVFLDCVVSDYFIKKGLLFEVKKYATGTELLESSDELDLLFLDITMPGLDGIETGKKFRETNDNLIIIYITAHEHYALEAFNIRAFHYLIKPVEQTVLYSTLDKALDQIDISDSRAVLNIKYVSIFVGDVTYVEMGNHQIIIHTKEKVYTVNALLKDYEVLLESLHFEKNEEFGLAPHVEKI